jgi:hypothetical protein
VDSVAAVDEAIKTFKLDAASRVLAYPGQIQVLALMDDLE